MVQSVIVVKTILSTFYSTLSEQTPMHSSICLEEATVTLVSNALNSMTIYPMFEVSNLPKETIELYLRFS